MDHFLINPYFLVGVYVASNVLALLSIFASVKKPQLARLFFLLLFGWACWINSSTALDAPWVYQDYADSSIPVYKRFILGAFEAIATPMVLSIAAAQGLIALSMILKGNLFRFGCWGGIVFCIAISPIGSYAAFPATLFMAVSLYLLQRKQGDLFIWGREGKVQKVKLAHF
ncbi:hypothetical protein [Dyadobacter sp. CY312]|uniref:hypothetical protein n=1 Tax=Dyadobacter sp. CY312 TaxID=2907303 RepID=UPI001F164419|nr:hypothetical protein [Dyadobacter sp. CY312]MCE7043788.1 hypothetical protein [Dyadobacter sp. CY312]